MARRKQQGSGAGSLLILLLAGTVVLFGIAGPIVLAVYWFWSEIRWSAVGKTSLEDQLPTEEERNELQRLEMAGADARSNARQLEKTGRDEGLSIRGDGMFDGRSHRGRALNAKLEGLTQAERSAKEEALAVREPIELRIETWVSRRAQVSGARYGVVGFLALSLGLYLARPSWIIGMGGMGSIVGLPESATFHLLLGTSATATAFALAVILIAGALKRGSLLR